jgi:hypothetical protein
VLLLRVIDNSRGVILYIFNVCVIDVFGHLVGAEVWCFWHLRDINFFL